jgi:hypothetical protein
MYLDLSSQRGPLRLVSTTEELLDRKEAAPVYKTENTVVGIPSRRPRGTLYPQKVGNHCADKRRSLGRYNSLMDSDHEVIFFFSLDPQFSDNFGLIYDRFPLFPIIYLSLHLFALSSLVIFLSYASRIHRYI